MNIFACASFIKFSVGIDFGFSLAGFGAFPPNLSLAIDFRSDLTSVGSRLAFPYKLSVAIDFDFG